MRTFKIVVLWILVALCVGLTGVIYLQSEGAALAVGSLLLLVIVSFLYDHRASIFSKSEAAAIRHDEAVGASVGHAVAMSRFADGEVRGAPNFKGNS
jgi:uncharacterized membrane protein YfcA